MHLNGINAAPTSQVCVPVMLSLQTELNEKVQGSDGLQKHVHTKFCKTGHVAQK
jgi:hypothetical protein